jgi:hypothetical protein
MIYEVQCADSSAPDLITIPPAPEKKGKKIPASPAREKGMRGIDSVYSALFFSASAFAINSAITVVFSISSPNP